MIEEFIDFIPDSLINDDGILFHGTSNIAEPFIDKNTYSPLFKYSAKDCESIIEIYAEINWDGLPGGFGVLSTFSTKDYKTENEKYLFLAVTVNRAALYATQNFAGGELVRSLYLSILHLKNYLEQEHLRNDHKADMELNLIYYLKKYDVDLKELTAKINKLEPIFLNLNTIRNSYQYGVIYCYKVGPNQYHKLKNRASMGIIVTKELDKSCLIAKINLKDSKAIESNNVRNQNLMIKKLVFWSENLIDNK